MYRSGGGWVAFAAAALSIGAITGVVTIARGQALAGGTVGITVEPPRAPGRLPTVIHPDGRGEGAVGRRGPGGHFFFDTVVNGTPVRMVFDTGATTVALRYEDAARAGVDVANLRFSGFTETANGRAQVAPLTISVFTVGGITRRNVAAHVSRPGALSVTLLGMSFMSRLSGYKYDGETLVLQDGF